MPVPAFLVEHPGAGPILIDTGFHPSVAANPTANLGRLAQITFKGIQMTADQAASAQLRERGIQPADVKVVLMTHLHVDHASAISEYPDSTFLVSAAEWAAASEHGQFHGYVKRQFDHGFDYRLLDFEGSGAAESFSGFARSFDVFGDGSVRTVYTPGHTLGHMSVVLRTARREVLIAADAIYMRRTLEDTRLPYRTADEHLFRRSLREIRQYRTETPEALIVPGHDWEAWQELDSGLLNQVARLGRGGDVDRPGLAHPGDQVERLEAVEHVLEGHRLGAARVVAPHVEGEAGGVQRVLARGERVVAQRAGAGSRRRARCSSPSAARACPRSDAPRRRGRRPARRPPAAARGRGERSASSRRASSPACGSSRIPPTPRNGRSSPVR